MQAFVINLDSAPERWSAVSEAFKGTGFGVVRVPAVRGRDLTLPIPEYSEEVFHRIHGRPTNLGEIGCYLSHVAACRAFLQTNEDFALICEDDITFQPGAEEAILEVVRYARHWDIIRLSGIGAERGVKAAKLSHGYHLSVCFKRQKGTGAYLVNRLAAQVIAEDFLPIKVPFDHAIDREWFYGLKACSVFPYPVCQMQGYRSSIQLGPAEKLSSFRRWLTTYPYQVFNETARWLNRGRMALLLLSHRLSA